MLIICSALATRKRLLSMQFIHYAILLRLIFLQNPPHLCNMIKLQQVNTLPMSFSAIVKVCTVLLCVFMLLYQCKLYNNCGTGKVKTLTLSIECFFQHFVINHLLNHQRSLKFIIEPLHYVISLYFLFYLTINQIRISKKMHNNDIYRFLKTSFPIFFAVCGVTLLLYV